MPGCLRLALVIVDCPGIAFARTYGSKLESQVGKEPSDGDHEGGCLPKTRQAVILERPKPAPKAAQAVLRITTTIQDAITPDEHCESK